MSSLAVVMFWKAVIVGIWSEYKEMRERRKARGVSPGLIAALKEEWDRRCAEQPRALPYFPPDLGE